MTKKPTDKARPSATTVAKNAGAQTSAPSNQEDVAAPQAGTTKPTAPQQPAPAPTVSQRPEIWSEIGFGSLVLATAGRADGWWEARVTAVNDAVLTLTWCDFPGEGPFLRRRTELALLPPTA